MTFPETSVAESADIDNDIDNNILEPIQQWNYPQEESIEHGVPLKVSRSESVQHTTNMYEYILYIRDDMKKYYPCQTLNDSHFLWSEKLIHGCYI